MTFTVRRFLCAPVSGGANAGGASATSGGVVASPLALAECGAFGDGANAGRAYVSRPDIDTSPRVLVCRCAVVNGAVRKLTANFLSPCIARNVSLRSARAGRANMEVGAQVAATRGLGYLFVAAAGCISSSRFGRRVRAWRLIPNPAVNRTRRLMASTWRAAARRAGYLARWAS